MPLAVTDRRWKRRSPRLPITADTGGTPEARERLLDEAADVVWAFFIQREVCGLRNSRDAIVRYRIPAEVIARLGIMRKP